MMKQSRIPKHSASAQHADWGTFLQISAFAAAENDRMAITSLFTKF